MKSLDLAGWRVEEKVSASVSKCAWQVVRHRNLFATEQMKIATKKMKKFVCGEVCAPEFARVGVQRTMVDGHRVFGSQVAKFVELVNNPPARGGGVDILRKGL
jgi:hypothetical protein